MQNKIKKGVFGWLIGLMSVGILWTGINLLLPGEIHLVEGKEHHFSFALPLDAKLYTEDIPVLQVNQKPVAENIQIDLSQPFTVQPQGQGSAHVTLRLFGVVPVKTVSAYVLPESVVVPSGRTVGIVMDTKGVMVLGTGFVQTPENKVVEPARGTLKSGDLILKVNGAALQNKEDLMSAVSQAGGKSLNLLLERNGEEKEAQITPAMSQDDQEYKIGVWVRDSTQGIGTLTYYNTQNGNFGALGHGVYDIDTKELMPIRQGSILKLDSVDVVKGEKGTPGEIEGRVSRRVKLGDIAENTNSGIFGSLLPDEMSWLEGKPMPIALKNEIEEGPASILCSIDGNQTQEYSATVLSISRFGDNSSKGLVLQITDPTLLQKTGGIIQGMSGSPIIQNGKLIGAVTHVFVQDPTKGYGIFIENMLAQ